MPTTRTPVAYLTVDPTPHDVHTLAAEAKARGCGITAHPDTLDALHAAVVVYGPMIHRTTLRGVLDVDVTADPGQPPGVVVLAP